MVWDDYYGKQNNPYDADDFRLILLALKNLVFNFPKERLDELYSLIRLTQKSLEIEEG
jgi:hypothetical protein